MVSLAEEVARRELTNLHEIAEYRALAWYYHATALNLIHKDAQRLLEYILDVLLLESICCEFLHENGGKTHPHIVINMPPSLFIILGYA